ncbi:unnamed protein product [Protopolystoma xenopodis]|uniref:Rab3-GAP regulatory subunit N-terminal domain-containing protein n=1 Tax=Protopolystoma xenopodis TaxID=117903 RepID=A0A448WKL6_9PLAT|nr:unnamed protein product [Protopolystoma xenopodis]
MAKLTVDAVYDAGERFANVPSPLFDVGNDGKYYGRRLRTRPYPNLGQIDCPSQNGVFSAPVCCWPITAFIHSTRRAKLEHSFTDAYRCSLAGSRAAFAPTSRLAAIPDNLARVSLIDLERGLIVRMWKGYRNAEVQFSEVPVPVESCTSNDLYTAPVYSSLVTPKTQNKRTLYLIILDPGRRYLEIWSMIYGPLLVRLQLNKPHLRLLSRPNRCLGGPRQIDSDCNLNSRYEK